MGSSGNDRDGTVDRDGVRIAYRTHGSGEPPVLCVPAWAISHSGIWDAQVDHLAGRHHVITFDPRGNGRSDRPADPSDYDPLTLASDAVAVLDAVGVRQAVVVGNSFGTVLAFLVASLHPERTLGAVFLDPSSVNLDGRTDDPFHRALSTFTDDLGSDEGWSRFNRHSWDRDYEGFVRWFMSEVFPEPDAGPARELGASWALGLTAEALAATIIGRLGTPPADTAARLRTLAERITCPALVIHGELDRLTPLRRSRALAEHLGAALIVLDGVGHCPQITAPDRVNQLLDDFLAHSSDHRPSAEDPPSSAPGRPAARFR